MIQSDKEHCANVQPIRVYKYVTINLREHKLKSKIKPISIYDNTYKLYERVPVFCQMRLLNPENGILRLIRFGSSVSSYSRSVTSAECYTSRGHFDLVCRRNKVYGYDASH